MDETYTGEDGEDGEYWLDGEYFTNGEDYLYVVIDYREGAY